MVKKKKKKSRVPFRLNIVFFAVFILFSILVVQLGIVQILEGATYQTEIDRKIEDISKVPVPRGEIYDSKYNLVVNNKPTYSITYTPAKRIQSKAKLELAEDLIKYMSVEQKDVEKVTDYNKKEYWYLKNTEEANNRLTEKEEKELDNTAKYKRALDLITEDEISDFTEKEMKAMTIKRELDKAYSLTPQVIKNENISIEEYATIAEHLSDLPGINVSTDWDREFLYDDTMRDVIGSITTQEQGIPADKVDTFLAKGYNRNDRVGKSGLEEEYEDTLRGRKENIQYTTTKSGKVIESKVVVPGERGKDIVLSIDMEYQKKADEILLKELKSARNSGNNYLEDALAVVMNPKTGEILALSGQHFDKEENEYISSPLRTLYDAHRPGSTVKGATVLAGLDSGVITPGQHFFDRSITIAGTPTKGSYTGSLGSVNDITALQKSSNVYMFYVALRMVGEYRYPFPNNASATFNRIGVDNMRNFFQQLGLGTHTGIDFPFEATGFVGPKPNPGLLMDLAIGQYDTYTTMQLAQYVSTIANDGYRVKPTLVKEIRSPSEDGGMGSIFKLNNTKILNEINSEPDHIKRVQEGFKMAFNVSGGTGFRQWSGKSYKAAGKTGTAENEVYFKRKDGTTYSVKVENLALVGYAPYDDPEVAFAVIVPQLNKNKGAEINHKIGTQLLDTYFDMKENPNGTTEDERNDE